MPDTRSVRWAIDELDAKGVVGDDFVEIEKAEGGPSLRIIKGGGGRFTLQASGGVGGYLIMARWLDTEETREMAETYNSGRSDWMYSAKWEAAGEEDIPSIAVEAEEDEGGGEQSTLLSVAFLPVVGILGIVWGGGGVGGVLGVLFLTAVAAGIIASPIFAKRIMGRFDGREVRDDPDGFVRMS